MTMRLRTTPRIFSRLCLKCIGKIADALRPAFGPNRRRREDVVRLLAQRPALTHEQWHEQFAAPLGISFEFVRWFRDTCSEHFGYDLAGALPDDHLVEDLGMYVATWQDVDLDILNDYQARFHAELPSDELPSILTFGQFLKALWTHAHSQSNVA